jgi:hypothetical protein
MNDSDGEKLMFLSKEIKKNFFMFCLFKLSTLTLSTTPCNYCKKKTLPENYAKIIKNLLFAKIKTFNDKKDTEIFFQFRVKQSLSKKL